MRTPNEAAEALKSIVGNKKNIETGAGPTLTKTPDRQNDVPVGIRHGKLKAIDSSKLDGFTHVVYFPETNTNVYARLSGILGIQSTPRGSWSGKVFNITDDVGVSVKIIKDTLKWEIVGFDNDLKVDPGTTVVNQGQTNLKVDEDWVYINGKKICVEGGACNNGNNNAEEQTVWTRVQDAIYVWYSDCIWIYSIHLNEWVNKINISNTLNVFSYPSINPDKIFLVVSPNRWGAIDTYSGFVSLGVNSSATYDRIVKINTELYGIQELPASGNLVFLDEYITPNTELDQVFTNADFQVETILSLHIYGKRMLIGIGIKDDKGYVEGYLYDNYLEVTPYTVFISGIPNGCLGFSNLDCAYIPTNKGISFIAGSENKIEETSFFTVSGLVGSIVGSNYNAKTGAYGSFAYFLSNKGKTLSCLNVETKEISNTPIPNDETGIDIKTSPTQGPFILTNSSIYHIHNLDTRITLPKTAPIEFNVASGIGIQ